MTLVFIGKGLVLGGLGPFKNRGHLGSRYIEVNIPVPWMLLEWFPYQKIHNFYPALLTLINNSSGGPFSTTCPASKTKICLNLEGVKSSFVEVKNKTAQNGILHKKLHQKGTMIGKPPEIFREKWCFDEFH